MRGADLSWFRVRKSSDSDSDSDSLRTLDKDPGYEANHRPRYARRKIPRYREAGLGWLDCDKLIGQRNFRPDLLESPVALSETDSLVLRKGRKASSKHGDKGCYWLLTLL